MDKEKIEKMVACVAFIEPEGAGDDVKELALFTLSLMETAQKVLDTRFPEASEETHDEQLDDLQHVLTPPNKKKEKENE